MNRTREQPDPSKFSKKQLQGLLQQFKKAQARLDIRRKIVEDLLDEKEH